MSHSLISTHMFDILPPPEHGEGTPTAHRHPVQRGKSEATGPLVADLFSGSTPRSVPAVIRVPSTLVLSVCAQPSSQGGKGESAPRERNTIEFHRGPSVPAPALVDRDRFLAEFAALFARDEERTIELRRRSRAGTSERREALRSKLASLVYNASAYHTRVRLPQRVSESRVVLRDRATLPSLRPTVRPSPPARAATARQPSTMSRSVSPSPASRRVASTFTALGFLALSGLPLILAHITSIESATERVRVRAVEGARYLLTGFQRLAVADARTSTQNFAAAHQSFASAARLLSGSVTALQRIAARLDPARRLVAARTLLDVGEQAAVLGREASALLGATQGSAKSLTESLEEARPRLARLKSGLESLAQRVARIPLSALPPEDASTVQTLSGALQLLSHTVDQFYQSQSVLLELLGHRIDRQYLILFQNSRELRPTGGFIGSFALVDVSRGTVRDVHVDSTYNPDGQLKDFIRPPGPLRKIVSRWFTRDANWFADFRLSAAKVAHLFERSGGPTVDGVIALTPYLLEDLLRLTGPITLPDNGVTVTAENVVPEIQRRVTFEYDRTQNQPKAFLADLLPQVLARTASIPKSRWGALIDVLTEALEKKQVLVFFRDRDAEDAVVRLGWGGALPHLPESTTSFFADHLGRVEANIGGHKTDALIEQSVEYDVTIQSDAAVIATLVVSRHHRGPKTGTPGLHPDEDPARKSNIVYERTFVPLGSTLLDARGFARPESVPNSERAPVPLLEPLERDPDLLSVEQHDREHENSIVVSQESGFTTFGGWVVTPPEETTLTVLRYRLPFRMQRPSLFASILRYQLFLTHQPGHLPVNTEATLRAPEGFHVTWVEPTQAIRRGSGRAAVFETVVDRDALWGGVFEER